MDRLRLVLAADEDLHADAARVQAERVLDVDGDLLVGELAEDARAAAGPQDHRAPGGPGIDRAQDAARQHQGVGVRDERHDVEVDALEARGRPLEVAVVDGQHHGAAALRAEDPGEPVLHAPVVGAGALEEEGRGFVRERRRGTPFGFVVASASGMTLGILR